MSGRSERDRWHLCGGKDPRDLPSYATWEAARYLRMPLRTVQNWAFGFGSYGGSLLIRVADPKRHQLSCWNVAELHVLGALRRYHQVSPQQLRRAIRYLEDVRKSASPVKMLTDGVSVIGEKTGTLINASKGGQFAMKEVIEAYLQRIEQDLDGLAIRLFPFVRHSGRQELSRPA